MNHYFASDIHLGAGGEAFAGETERRFVAWLDDAAKDAESIFLVGDHLARECGVEVYTSPQRFCLNGKHLFIAHGDNMKIDGQPVLKLLNTVFRSRTLRWLFSWLLHPDWAMRFGHWWSGKSRKSHAADTLDVSLTEPLIQYAREYAAMHDVDHFVFGHMHFPRDFREGNLHVINLGCWEQYPSYAVLDASGELTLRRLEAFR